jgi:uncharacterized protein (TIGR02996 family)
MKIKDLAWELHPVAIGGYVSVVNFQNGYGASVLKGGRGLYTKNRTYEIGVLHNGELDYDNPVTPVDVLGFLTEKEADKVLAAIEALPPKEGMSRFIKRICENPKDDFAFLVYAEWLEDNGKEAEALEIRRNIGRETEFCEDRFSPSRNISEILGKTIVSIDGKRGDKEIEIRLLTGEIYMLQHFQDCCEHVYVEDIAGNFEDLIGRVVTMAEESSNRELPTDMYGYSDSQTWTFYRLASVRGYVTIRFLGTSNGYYSERVSFTRTR